MLNPDGVIFSTVTAFVEQVGRRQQWRYADLDVMVCTWNGPAAGASNFKPKVGSPHPQYPLMFVTDSEIVSAAALVAEVQATYQGIIQTSGVKQYYTDPVVSMSPTGGSREFTRIYSQQVMAAQYTTNQFGQPVTGYSTPALYNYGTQSVTVRYTGVQCSVKYQTYPSVNEHSPHFSSLGLGRVMWQVLSTYYGAVSIIGSNVEQVPSVIPGVPIGVPPLFAAYMGMNVQQRGKWWDVTEIYGPTF